MESMCVLLMWMFLVGLVLPSEGLGALRLCLRGWLGGEWFPTYSLWRINFWWTSWWIQLYICKSILWFRYVFCFLVPLFLLACMRVFVFYLRINWVFGNATLSSLLYLPFSLSWALHYGIIAGFGHFGQ